MVIFPWTSGIWALFMPTAPLTTCVFVIFADRMQLALEIDACATDVTSLGWGGVGMLTLMWTCVTCTTDVTSLGRVSWKMSFAEWLVIRCGWICPTEEKKTITLFKRVENRWTFHTKRTFCSWPQCNYDLTFFFHVFTKPCKYHDLVNEASWKIHELPRVANRAVALFICKSGILMDFWALHGDLTHIWPRSYCRFEVDGGTNGNLIIIEQ